MLVWSGSNESNCLRQLITPNRAAANHHNSIVNYMLMYQPDEMQGSWSEIAINLQPAGQFSDPRLQEEQ